MKILAQFFWTLFFSCFFFAVISQSLEQDLDRILQSNASVDAPGMTALVAKDGKVIYRKSFGLANLESGMGMNPNQVFRIGSITKQFTAMAILKLAEEQQLNLRDSIQQYVSDFPSTEHPLTIEHLLTHTSGIKNYTAIEHWEESIKTTQLTPKELIDVFKREPLAFQPGEQYYYSNLGYLVLGHIIELVSGHSFAQYLETSFFEPLQMKQTHYDDPAMNVANRIAGYSKHEATYSDAAYLNMKLPYAAGGLISTVDDLLIWNEQVFKGKLMTSNLLKNAHMPFQLNNGQAIPYGYGWKIGNIQGTKSIKHDGIINGFTTFSIYLPEHDVFVALFSNCDCKRDIEEPASQMAAVAMGKPFELDPIVLSKAELMNYQGIYQSTGGTKKYITYQDGQLMYHDKGGRKTPLLPTTKNEFIIGDQLASISFSTTNDPKNPSFVLQTLELPTQWERISSDVVSIESLNLEEIAIEKFLGKYEFKGAFTLEIIKVEDQVFGQVGNDRKELLPYDSNKFSARFTDIKLIFDLDEQEVTGLTLVQGMEMQARKVE